MSAPDDLARELSELQTRGLRRHLRTVRGPGDRTVELDGRAVLNFSSNNYLGLANHPDLQHAAAAALTTAGLGATASRLIVGNHERHEQLEQTLAAFHHRPAARLFNSGYNANIGVLQALARPDDVIFSDQLNHASIIDGCRLSRARVCVYPHSDLATLDSMLQTHTGARRFVVTDSVFSMDGDRARLAELSELCRRHHAALIIDEAHAIGVLGPQGRGLAAELDVVSEAGPDVVVGTLGKSFGSFGAYAAGSRQLAEILLNRARSFIFTTALPPSIAAAGQAAVQLVAGPEGDRRRTHLHANIARFTAGLSTRGLLAPGSGSTPIFPIMVGDDTRAMACSEKLLSRGVYVQGIRPPTVAPGTARLRVALMATHRPNDIDAVLAGLDELLAEALLTPLPDRP